MGDGRDTTGAAGRCNRGPAGPGSEKCGAVVRCAGRQKARARTARGHSEAEPNGRNSGCIQREKARGRAHRRSRLRPGNTRRLAQGRSIPTGRMAQQACVTFYGTHLRYTSASTLAAARFSQHPLAAHLCPVRIHARRQAQAGFAWAQQPAWPKSKENSAAMAN